MGAHQTADSRGGEYLLLVRLPAEQTGDRLEGQLLGQQAGHFLSAAGDDHPPVGREHSVARQGVPLGARINADLPRQV